MKKILYHYLNLLIAALQCFLTVLVILSIFLEVTDFVSFIPIFIIFMGPNILISIFLDPFVREMKEPWMGVASILLSPIRVFAQLYTIIKVHIAENEGVSDFAERGDYCYDFMSMLTYVLFSTDEPFVTIKDGVKQVVITNNQQKEINKRNNAMKEIKETATERNNTVINNKADLSKPNVLLAPIIILGNTVKYFGGYDRVRSNYLYNGSSRYPEQIAKITKLLINDTNYLGANFKAKYPMNEISSLTGLYLRPGTYKISIEFELHIAPPQYGKNFNPYKIKRSDSLTLKVESLTQNYYLGLVFKLGFGWTEVSNKYGQRIEDKDSKWNVSWGFRKYSFQELNSILYNIDKNWYIHSLTIEN